MGIDPDILAIGIGVTRQFPAHCRGVDTDFAGNAASAPAPFSSDGLLAALQVLTIMCESGKKLSELAQKLKLYPQEMENVEVTRKPDLATVPEIQEALKNAESQLGQYGRVVLRYSGTENLCRVMVEAREEKLVKQLTKELAKVVHAALNK